MTFSVNPKWHNGEYFSADKFMTRIEDNLQWLRNRNIKRLIIRNGVSDLTQATLLTWQACSDTVLYVDIETQGCDLMVSLKCGVHNTGANGKTLLDFFVRPLNKTGFFLSSLTATPLATGLFTEQMGTSYVRTRTYKFLWSHVAAGNYRITPYWQAVTGTNSMNLTNTVTELCAEEYGVYTEL